MKKFLYIVLLLGFGLMANAQLSPSNSYGADGKYIVLKGVKWKYFQQPSIYTGSDSLRLVYWKQLTDSCRAIEARLNALDLSGGTIAVGNQISDSLNALSAFIIESSRYIDTSWRHGDTGDTLQLIFDSTQFFIDHPNTSGIYTPTGTNGTNASANTPGIAHWTRTINEVDVDGQVSITVTGSGDAVITLTLPIASDFTATSDARGMAANVTNHSVAEAIANTTSNQVVITCNVAAGGTFSIFYHYKYTVK